MPNQTPYERFLRSPLFRQQDLIRRGFTGLQRTGQLASQYKPGGTYWYDPRNVVKWKQKLDAQLPGEEIDPWLDRNRDGIQAAYNYYDLTNNGAPWQTWTWPDLFDDVGQSFLSSLEPPSENQDFKYIAYPDIEGEQVIPTIGEPDAEGGETPYAPPPDGTVQSFIQKLFQSTTGQALAGGAPVGLAAGGQAALEALAKTRNPLAAAGAFVAGLVGGEALGAGIAGLSIRTQGTPFGDKLLDSLMLLDYPAEYVERPLGMLGLGYYSALKKSFETGRVTGKDSGAEALSDFLTNWDKWGVAGHFLYDYLGASAWAAINPKVDKPQEDFWDIWEQAKSGKFDGMSLIELNEYAFQKYGNAGLVGDTIGHILLDPLNLIGVGLVGLLGDFNKLRGVFAKTPAVIKSVNAMQAAVEIEKAKGLGRGMVGALQTYGSLLRSGRFATVDEVSQMGAFSRYMAQVTKAKKPATWERLIYAVDQPAAFVPLTQPKPTKWNRLGGSILSSVPASVIGYGIAGPAGGIVGGLLGGSVGYWRFMTPSSRAAELTNNLWIHAGQVIQQGMDAGDDVAEINKYIRGLEKTPEDIARLLSMQTLEGPEGATIPRMLQGFDEDVLVQMESSWNAMEPQRRMLENIAAVVGQDVHKVYAQLAKAEDTSILLRQYVDAAAKLDTPEARSIVAAYKSTKADKLDAARLSDMVKAFKAGEPYTREMYAYQVLAAMAEYGDKWAAAAFQIKPNPLWNRVAGMVKSAQSIALLGWNPNYFIVNALSNITTQAYTNVLGFRSPELVGKYWDRMGVEPLRLRAGIGMADTGEIELLKAKGVYGYIPNRTTRQIVQSGGGVNRLVTDATRVISTAQTKYTSPFTAASMQFEQWSSVQAFTAGTMQAMSGLWKPGVGFDPLPDPLRLALQKLDPNLPDLVYQAIQSGMSRKEIEAALFEDATLYQLDAAINKVAELGKFDPATLRSSLVELGVYDNLKESLQGNFTAEGVRETFADLYRQIDKHFNEVMVANLEREIEKAAQKVSTEGLQALLDIVYNQYYDNLEQRFNTLSRWEFFFDELDTTRPKKAVKNQLFRNQFSSEDVNWKRQWLRNESHWLGITKALGVNNPTSRDLLKLVKQLSEAWSSVHTYRQTLYMQHFSMDFASRKEAKIHWLTTKNLVRSAMETAYVEEARLLTDIGERFATVLEDYVAKSYGEAQARKAGEAVREWYKSLVANMGMIGVEMGEFYRSLDKMAREEKLAAWQEFNTAKRIPRFVDNWRISTSGVQDVYRAALGEEPPGAVMPVMPERPPSRPMPEITTPPEPDTFAELLPEQRPRAEEPQPEFIPEVTPAGNRLNIVQFASENGIRDEDLLLRILKTPDYGGALENTLEDTRLSIAENAILKYLEDPSKVVRRKPKPSEVKAHIREIASEYGISTVDVAGRPVSGADIHILNVVKKYGGDAAKEYARLEEVDPDIARDAFIARQEAKLVEPPKEAITGNKSTALGQDSKTRHEFVYRVVELDDLITSHNDDLGVNPNYPQELQPRQRERMASSLQIDAIASDLTPESLLLETHRIDTGTMIIGPDLVVESGNGRTLALRRARAAFPDQYENYKAAMLDYLPSVGIDPERIRELQFPVLVRERISDVNRAEFAEDAARRATLDLSPLEQAVIDARNMPLDLISTLDIGDDQGLGEALRLARNRPIIQKFMATLGENERAQYLDAKGDINVDGLKRLERAVFLATYKGDSGVRLFSRFMESTNPGVQNMYKAIVETLGQVAKLETSILAGRSPESLSIADDISAAIDVYVRLKQGEIGISVDDYVKQLSMFDPELNNNQVQLLKYFDQNSRSSRAIKNLVLSYIDGALKQAPESQVEMFAGTRVTKGELLNDATTKAGKAEGLEFTPEQPGEVYVTGTEAERTGLGRSAETEEPLAAMAGEEEPTGAAQPGAAELGIDDSLEPWLMRRDEFPNQDIHKELVADAIEDGKIIPDEVLADYPDLAATYAAKLQKTIEDIEEIKTWADTMQADIEQAKNAPPSIVVEEPDMRADITPPEQVVRDDPREARLLTLSALYREERPAQWNVLEVMRTFPGRGEMTSFQWVEQAVRNDSIEVVVRNGKLFWKDGGSETLMSFAEEDYWHFLKEEYKPTGEGLARQALRERIQLEKAYRQLNTPESLEQADQAYLRYMTEMVHYVDDITWLLTQAGDMVQKSWLDNHLMQTFGIDEYEARTITNQATSGLEGERRPFILGKESVWQADRPKPDPANYSSIRPLLDRRRFDDPFVRNTSMTDLRRLQSAGIYQYAYRINTEFGRKGDIIELNIGIADINIRNNSRNVRTTFQLEDFDLPEFLRTIDPLEKMTDDEFAAQVLATRLEIDLEGPRYKESIDAAIRAVKEFEGKLPYDNPYMRQLTDLVDKFNERLIAEGSPAAASISADQPYNAAVALDGIVGSGDPDPNLQRVDWQRAPTDLEYWSDVIASMVKDYDNITEDELTKLAIIKSYLDGDYDMNDLPDLFYQEGGLFDDVLRRALEKKGQVSDESIEKISSEVRRTGARRSKDVDTGRTGVSTERAVSKGAGRKRKPGDIRSYLRSLKDPAPTEELTVKKAMDVLDERAGQVTDARKILTAFRSGKPAYLLANGTGTGKTFVALGTILEMGVDRAVIVVPSSQLADKWALEAKQFFGMRLYTGDTPPDKGVWVISYNRMKDMERAIIARQYPLIIFDESHKLKNFGLTNSAVGPAGVRIVEQSPSSKTLYMSATPFQSLLEMRYMKQLLGLNDEAFDAYLDDHGYAYVDKGKYGFWKFFGKTEDLLDIYKDLVEQGVSSWREIPMDVDLDNRFYKVPLPDLHSGMYARMDEAFKAAVQLATSEGWDLKGMINAQRTIALRRLMEVVKVDEAVRLANYYLKQGRQVSIFVGYKGKLTTPNFGKNTQNWRYKRIALQINSILAGIYDDISRADGESVRRLIEALGGEGAVAQIHGDVPENRRMKEILDYNTGRKKVIIATAASGGTGLSLHDTVGNAPRAQINIHLPWSGQEFQQVAGRSYRYGSKSDVIQVWLAADTPKEDAITTVIGTRLAEMGALVRGARSNATADALINFDFGRFDEDALDDNVLFQFAPRLLEQSPYLPGVKESRADIRSQWEATKLYTKEELDSLMTVLDAAATKLAQWNNMSKQEWYDLAFGGVRQGERLMQENINWGRYIAEPEYIDTARRLVQESRARGADSDILERAVYEFGTTRDIREAGYILPDGRMLDLSGRREGSLDKGVRYMDHSDIGRLGPSMWEWMGQTGAIRISESEYQLYVETTGMISNAQRSMLSRLIRNYESFVWDISDSAGEYIATGGEYAPDSRRSWMEFTRVLDDVYGERPPAQRVDTYNPDLYAMHNLTADNLIHADELGGLAVPSIAITTKDLDLPEYGEITLIGTRNMIDPRRHGNRVFGADAYSPTWPQLYWRKVPTSKVEKVTPRFRKVEKEWTAKFGRSFIEYIERGWISNELWDRQVNRPDRNSLISEFDRHVFPKLVYMTEKGMIDINDFPQISRLNMLDYNLGENQELLAYLRSHKRIWREDRSKHPELYRIIRKAMEDKYTPSPTPFETRLDRVVERTLQVYYRYDTEFDIDSTAVERFVRAAFEDPNVVKDYRAWAAQFMFFDNPKIKVSGKKVDYTLENVVAAMTAKPARASEEGMTFGPAKAKAYSTQEFKSIDEMHGAKGIIASRDQVKAAEKAAEAIQAEYMTAVQPFYYAVQKYGDSFSNLWDSNDSAWKAIGYYVKGRKGHSESAARQALGKAGFTGVSDAALQLFMQAADSVRDFPVAYFEAKPQRAVYFSEFAGAVIPNNSPERVREILRRQGIPFVEYDPSAAPGDPGSRRNGIRSFHDKQNVLFQNNERWYYSPMQRTIATMPQERMTIKQFRGWLASRVKPDEYKWSGMGNHLDVLERLGHTEVTKADMERWARNNIVNVEDSLKGVVDQKILDRANELDKTAGELWVEMMRRNEILGEEWRYFTSDNDYWSDRINLRGETLNLQWFIDHYGYLDEAEEGSEVYKVMSMPGWDYVDNALSDYLRHRTRYQHAKDEVNRIKGKAYTEAVYPQFNIPGGENYKELLLRFPRSGHSEVASDYVTLYEALGEAGIELKVVNEGLEYYEATEVATGRKFKRTTTNPASLLAANPELYNLYMKRMNLSKNYGHWTDNDVILHVRMDDRNIGDERVLFAMEVQSDWHQRGRKYGYMPEEYVGDIEQYVTVTLEDGWYAVRVADNDNAARMLNKTKKTGLSWGETPEKALAEAIEIINFENLRMGLPPGPFSKTWPELAVKRVIRWAAENGYNQIAFPSGPTAAAVEGHQLVRNYTAMRYTPESGVLEIWRTGEFHPEKRNIDINELHAWVGWDVADALKNNPDTKIELGQNFIFGGEKMRWFYDRELVKTIERYIKQWDGAKLREDYLSGGFTGMEYDADLMGQPVHLTRFEGSGPPSFRVEFENGSWEVITFDKFAEYKVDGTITNVRETSQRLYPVYILELTPEMKQTAMTGQPLFQGSQGPKGAVMFADDMRAMIYAFETADTSTFLHEHAHIFRRWLPQEEHRVVLKWLKDEYKYDLKLDDRGRFMGDPDIARDAEELYAKAFEQYIREGRAPTPGLRQHFERLKQLLAAIYARLKGSPLVKINDDLRKHFDRLLGGDDIVSESPWFETSTGQARVVQPDDVYPGAGLQDRVFYQSSDGVHAIEPDEGVDPIRMPLHTVDATDRTPPAGAMTEEHYLENMQPRLQQVEGLLASGAGKEKTLKQYPIDPVSMRQLRGYLGKVYGQLADTKTAAMRVGEMKRDFALLNYSKRYEWDNVLGAVFPYQFWYTRSAMNWALRALDKPSVFVHYARVRNALNKINEKEGIPTRLKNKIKLPWAPYSPDWLGEMWMDPFRWVFPFEQITQPIQRYWANQSQIDRRASYIVQDWLADGTVSPNQANAAEVWQRARAEAANQMDMEEGNPWDLASAMSGPSLPIQWAANFMRGKPEKISQLPVTRFIQSVTSVAGMNKGRGVNIEAPLRNFLNMPTEGNMADYYIDRLLSQMTFRGEISPEEAKQAMVERSGPAFEEAGRRAGKYQSLRYFASVLALDTFPEPEKEMRALREEYSKAIEEGKVAEFYDKYPEYEAQLYVGDDPEEKLRRYLRSQVWQGYMDLSSANKRIVRDNFGELFQTSFLDRETRSYDAINTTTLATWAHMLGEELPEGSPELADVPGPELLEKEIDKAITEYREGLKRFPKIDQALSVYYMLDQDAQVKFRKKYPQITEYETWKYNYLATHPEIIPYVISDDNELSGVDPTVAAQVYAYRVERNRTFPNYLDLQTQYFAIEDQEQRKVWLRENPELSNYWTWQRYYLAQNPALIPYIKSDQSISEAVLGKDFETIYSLEPIDMSSFQPALVRQLIAYYTVNQKLTTGATKVLRKEWEDRGRPGEFWDWVNVTLRYNITGQAGY